MILSYRFKSYHILLCFVNLLFCFVLIPCIAKTGAIPMHSFISYHIMSWLFLFFSFLFFSFYLFLCFSILCFDLVFARTSHPHCIASFYLFFLTLFQYDNVAKYCIIRCIMNQFSLFVLLNCIWLCCFLSYFG
jgi:hypothetical protein